FEKLAVDDRAGLLRMWLEGNAHAASPTDEPESAGASSGDTALGTGGFVAQVRQIIDESLRAGHLDLDAVARRLEISPRRLQRALTSNGTHFRELVDKARHERALLLLSRPWLNLTEVAQELGYGRVASLHRAVKRWTGKTPVELRDELLERA
ncbi:MAG: helix-turn-helix transcriptional regulator, partial [Persicimonas sp.]